MLLLRWVPWTLRRLSLCRWGLVLLLLRSFLLSQLRRLGMRLCRLYSWLPGAEIVAYVIGTIGKRRRFQWLRLHANPRNSRVACGCSHLLLRCHALRGRRGSWPGSCGWCLMLRLALVDYAVRRGVLHLVAGLLPPKSRRDVVRFRIIREGMSTRYLCGLRISSSAFVRLVCSLRGA